MPELPEVETVVRALNAALLGRSIAKAVFLGKVRVPFDATEATRALRGRSITGVRRRAKYIVVDFDCDAALLAHLGMTGFFHIESASSPYEKHDRIAFLLTDGEELRYADARRFGFVRLARVSEPAGWPGELSFLGVEPLGRSFTGNYLHERAKGRKTPVKVFIMDQEIVVGVGNIYASEALFAAGVDPRRPAGSLTPGEWKRIAAEIKGVLRYAIKMGGSTIKNYRAVDGTEGAFQRVLKIYGKKAGTCPVCGAGVETVRLGGRSTFFCPSCQA